MNLVNYYFTYLNKKKKKEINFLKHFFQKLFLIKKKPKKISKPIKNQ